MLIIDEDMLRLGGVSHELTRLKYFTSDNLAKQLASFETASKVKSAVVELGFTIEGDRGNHRSLYY